MIYQKLPKYISMFTDKAFECFQVKITFLDLFVSVCKFAGICNSHLHILYATPLWGIVSTAKPGLHYIQFIIFNETTFFCFNGDVVNIRKLSVIPFI